MSSETRLIYKFDSFRLDPANHLLTHHGQPIQVAPKPFEILSLLVQRHGQIVHKDELINSIWADAFVEEANISQNIFLLRKLLEKNADGRQYIETVPRRGYRFVAKVRIEQQRKATPKSDQRIQGHVRAKGKGASALRQNGMHSLAVLPLVNVGEDPDMEYLSDGITESLINSLAQLPYLRIIARTAVFRYKGRDILIKDVGHDLNVDFVVMGRTAMRGDTLNLQVELINVVDESQSWGQQYNLKVMDLLDVEAEITKEISAQLKITFTSEEQKRVAKRHTDNVEAYKLYLKGRYHQNKLTEEGLRQGVECFLQAIAMEPEFALAYAGLSDCYVLGGLPLDPSFALAYAELVDCYALATAAPKEAMSKAKAASLRALEIDDTLAEAHVSLGFVRYRLDWDWAAAEKAYRRAIELRPNYATAHYRLSMCLRTLGRLDEALAEAKLSHDLDPFMLINNVELGRIFYFARYYDQAIEQYKETLALDPNFLPAHFRLGQAYVQKRMYKEAIAEFEQAMPLLGDDSEAIAAIAHAQAVSGNGDEAQKTLKKLKEMSLQHYISAYDLAIIYVGLDEKEKALEWLQNAYADRSIWLIGIKVEPMLDSLRSDPRFTELMRRVGFVP
jgi:DNA-binding winged helix-turn-helix (wHTH) protein/Tfp pilus assembly protein PilF